MQDDETAALRQAAAKWTKRCLNLLKSAPILEA